MNSKDVGAIKSVDGIDIQNITRDVRTSWFNKLTDKIENLEAVEKTEIEDCDSSMNEIRFFVKINSEETPSGYKLHINKRRFSQILSNIVRSDKYVSANIVESNIETPEKTGDNIYNTPYYFVTVYYP